jgi:biotin carboxylase
MYEELKGKKLLIIGADVNDMEIVRTAQAMGIHTIVVDWTTDYSKSPAKRLADEAWDMNYRDLDALEERCVREQVDGVMAGYSETRVLLAAQLCQRLGKPFYATDKIVEITRDKRSFKSLCRAHNVPIPEEYCATGTLTEEDLKSMRFPVIIKPADYGGHFGITICEDGTELNKAVEKALSCSENKKVVIEEYVTGIEMCSIYNISDGDIALAYVNDKYQVVESGKTTILCHATVTPSKHMQEYMETVDPHIKDFLRGIGARNGIALFQMIAGEKGIRVFEMGYRLNGGNDQHTIEKYNHINHMKMLISCSLTGSMGDDIHKNNPDFGEYVAVYLAYVHGGTVGKVEYKARVGENDVIAITQKVFPGTVLTDNYTTQQEGVVIKFRAATLEEVARKMNEIRDGIVVESVTGEDMLFDRFDTRRLLE